MLTLTLRSAASHAHTSSSVASACSLKSTKLLKQSHRSNSSSLQYAAPFIRFLKKINRAVAKHLDVHAICDNYKTHKTKEVQAWLAKHPRFKLHFTPTSSSWINLVERLFAEITRQQIRRGVFKSVAELKAAIETWLTERNAKPKPFKWTAKANIILEKNARARRALEEDLAAGTK